MNDQEIIIEVSKLDDIMYEWCESLGMNAYYSKCSKVWYPSPNKIPYLTSRDAIIPVIEKQDMIIAIKIIKHLHNSVQGTGNAWLKTFFIITASSHQLCIALLKATGKWKD